ncbi:MAG: caspase family protein [Rikenellaceae bacterium]
MKKFLSLIITILLSVTLNAQNIYLVAVGVADYPGTDSDLSYTVKDAQLIKSLFEKNKNAKSVLLTNSQATKTNLLRQMQITFANAKAEDIVVLFFSGHGYEGGLCTYGDYTSYEEIKKVISKSKAMNKVIFADACYSGTLRETQNTSANSAPIKDLNVLLFLSSRSNETSLESSSVGNGFFTTFLNRGLRGNADSNKDRIITAKELFMFVNQGVVNYSKGKQHPVMWGRFEDDMPVMVW